MEIEMKRGKKHGKFIERYFNGNMKTVSYYQDDLLEGVENKYYMTGNISLQAHYKKGVKNGPITTWYSNGVIRESGYLVNEMYDGEWENYDERGMLVGEGIFVNGTGKRFSYDEIGRLRSETNFVNNKKEGLETHYLPSGEIEKTILFKEDRIIEINGKTIEDL